MLRIWLLGELRVEADGREVELPGSWRARSLLAWLAAHPGTHQRSEVAPLFWAEILDESARASLRNALWAIRKALGGDADALVATRERVGLAEPPAVWVDVAEFAELSAKGELERALDLSRGTPLAGFEDDWAYELRDDHREALSGVLEQLAAKAEANSDGAAATEWARRRVALDPLDEAAQRALIARMIEAGDRSGAISAYGRFRQSSARSSASPRRRRPARWCSSSRRKMPATTQPACRSPRPSRGEAIGGQVRRFPLPAKLATQAPTALVGRAAKLERLRGLSAGVQSGSRPRIAIVTGEAGIGKSRLASEVAHDLQADGAIVLHGQADEELLVPHRV